MRTRAYNLLRSVVAPTKPKALKFKELTAALVQHFSPKKSVISERFGFYKREQAPTESVSDYTTVLRKLSEHCKFETFLDTALRDRLVCGLRNESAQKWLLAETDLTLKKAIEIAQAMEAADTQSK